MITKVFKRIYTDIDTISFKKGTTGYDIETIQKGDWSLLIYEQPYKGIYLYNPLFISQVYSDRRFDLSGKKLEIHFNKTRRFKNEDKSYHFDGIKIYDNGILFLDDIKIYPSAYFDNLCGLMLVND